MSLGFLWVLYVLVGVFPKLVCNHYTQKSVKSTSSLGFSTDLRVVFRLGTIRFCFLQTGTVHLFLSGFD